VPVIGTPEEGEHHEFVQAQQHEIQQERTHLDVVIVCMIVCVIVCVIVCGGVVGVGGGWVH